MSLGLPEEEEALEGLRLSSGLGMPGDPSRRAGEGVCGQERVDTSAQTAASTT